MNILNYKRDTPTRSGATAMSTPLPTAPKPEYGLAHHVYGKQAALYFSVDTTRSGQPTLMLEAALANAPQSYNWTEKIRIQFTPRSF